MPALACLALPVAVQGQVVNIENKRFADDTSRWSANAGFRFLMVENTQRSIELGAKGGVQFVHQAHRAFFITDFSLSRVEDNAFTNTGFQHLRYQRALRGPFTAEGYLQLQYNKPLRIDAQVMIGAGPRWVLRDAEHLRLAVGASVLYEHEEDRVNGLRYDDARSSTYLSVGFKVEPQVQFTSVCYFQPLLGDIGDHRLMLEGQVLVRATRRFAMETRLSLQKDTKVAPAVPRLSCRWENGLVFRW
ncbi:MAG: DUF481 domain-containing protein [Flavobacteriales bacterium]